LEIPVFEISNFIQAFISTHINKQVPLGFITEDTLAPFESKKNKYKYAPLVHHNIISAIYKEIWLTSRAVQHDPVFSTPPPIQPPILTKTKSITSFLLNEKIQRYITYGQSSLHFLIED